MKAPSPKARHRAGVMKRWGEVCYARAKGGCAGRIEAAHWIATQRLAAIQTNARIAIRNGREVSDPRRLLVDMPLTGLIADDRNGVPLCMRHHASFDKRNGQELVLMPPGEVREFAEEYDLDDELEYPAETPCSRRSRSGSDGE